MGSFVYKEHEQILQKTISDVKEKLNIDFVETFFGYNKVYKFKDFSLSYLSSTSYSQHFVFATLHIYKFKVKYPEQVIGCQLVEDYFNSPQ